MNKEDKAQMHERWIEEGELIHAMCEIIGLVNSLIDFADENSIEPLQEKYNISDDELIKAYRQALNDWGKFQNIVYTAALVHKKKKK